MGPARHRRPTATVLIPTRDRAAWLRRALAGALAQQEVELRVVVVDDGSVDATPEVLATLGDERVEVVRHERSRGVAAARNAALARADGEWVAFLDDDDLWAPDYLRRQIAAARAHGAAFSGAAAVLVTEHLEPLRLSSVPEEPVPLAALARWNVIGGPSRVVACADAVREAGAFDERLNVMADWELYLRLARRSPAATLTEPLVAISMHGSNMQATQIRGIPAELRYIERKHGELRIGSPQLWRWRALVYAQAGRRGMAALSYARAAARYHLRPDAINAVRALGPGRAVTAARPEPAPGWLRCATKLAP